MATDAEIAWAAGLFEGEGSWGVYAHHERGNPRAACRAQLGMTDRDVVERFHRIVGFGNVTTRQPNRSNRQRLYIWASGEAAAVRSLVELFRPWLGSRRLASGEKLLRDSAHIQVHSRLRTHCPKGHPLSGPNLMPYFHPKRPDRMVRKCRACTNQSTREWQRKRLGITPDRYRVA